MSEQPKKRGYVKQAVRWIPLAFLVVITIWMVITIFNGGLASAFAWTFLPLWLSFIGVVTLVPTLIYAAWKRRWKSPAVLTTLGVSFLATLSLFWTFELAPPLMKYPVSINKVTPAATVRLPANVPLKVMWGGDSLRANYHTAYPAQRWAYDLAVEPFQLGSDELNDYGCFGVDVVAPASGLVSTAHDGEPDVVPSLNTVNYEQPSGNHVVIKLDETNTYVGIAHLQAGSVRVEAGQHVNEGDIIGKCGNSGNTSEPHIHIHHQRQDPAQTEFNTAEGLPLYFRDHDGVPMPIGGFDASGAIGDTVRHIKTNQ